MQNVHYTREEMLAWARYYQRVSRQYHERGRRDLAAKDAARGREFLFAVLEGRTFRKF